MNLSILFVLCLMVSCSRINQQSRDYYHSLKSKHGIIPLPSASFSERGNESIARGKALYRQYCLSCHGEKGMGNGPMADKQITPPSNLQKLAREVQNFRFFMSESQSEGKMPGWTGPFDDVDNEDLVAYIKNFR